MGPTLERAGSTSLTTSTRVATGEHRRDHGEMRPDPPITPALTPYEDLVTFQLGRRVLRRDVALHVEFAGGLLAGTQYLDPRRLEAFSALAEELCDDILHEQLFEETLLWPALERRAPDAMPFVALGAERAAIRGQVGDARRATRAVVANLAQRPATLATHDDHRRVQVFAGSWEGLREGLERFFDASDDGVAEIVTAQVPREEWRHILGEVRRRLPDRRSAGARVIDVASRKELEQLSGQLGARPLAGWHQQVKRRRSVEALVFGSAVDRRAGDRMVPDERDAGQDP
jgi:hypothetical protein